MPDIRANSVRGVEPSTTVITTQNCMVCNKPGEVAVPTEDYKKFKMNENVYIQDAFPTLSATEREMLITGTHGPCFDNLFGDIEED